MDKVTRVEVELFGSLGQTGKGHGTGKAVILGLLGQDPKTVDVDHIPTQLAAIEKTEQLALLGKKTVAFPKSGAITFHRRQSLPKHANGMIFRAYSDTTTVFEQTYYSIGGGFIVEDSEFEAVKNEAQQQQTQVPYVFESCDELLALCAQHNLSIRDLVLANEQAFHALDIIHENIDAIWQTMKTCIERGCQTTGVLPGGLKVVRRAPALYEQLKKSAAQNSDPLLALEWADLYAIAVNEENAAGHRVVTAPTNGAAGIIPAVLYYYDQHVQSLDREQLLTFFLTAAAIGILYKKNASISGAEVGCQGEVGVACLDGGRCAHGFGWRKFFSNRKCRRNCDGTQFRLNL